MTDLLTILGDRTKIKSDVLPILVSVKWVKSATISDAWGHPELRINGASAIRYLIGKHRAEVRDWLAKIQASGFSVVLVKLRDDKVIQEPWSVSS